jgi:hypothetical protein
MYNKFLKITMLKNDGSEIILTYMLEDNNPVVDKWIEMTKKSIKNNMKIKASLNNVEINNISILLKKINDVLYFINNHYDKKLPVFTNFYELDNIILNYLHEEFEIYGDRIEELQSKNNWSYELHENFLSLNEYIHMIETAMHGSEDNFPNFSCLYDFTPAGLHEPIKEEYKHFLENKFEWGGLYCGYNTLGKDYLSIAPENDWEVIERDEVRPQIRFAAETWMNFGPDLKTTINKEFYKWYTTLPNKIQNKIPIDDLNKLSLGRYSLGKIIIDENFLSIEPDAKKWLLPTGSVYSIMGKEDCKTKWNREVFAKIVDIKRIEIIEK